MRFDKEEAPMMRDLPPTPFTEVSYKRLNEALDYATPLEIEPVYYLTQPINTGP